MVKGVLWDKSQQRHHPSANKLVKKVYLNN